MKTTASKYTTAEDVHCSQTWKQLQPVNTLQLMMYTAHKHKQPTVNTHLKQKATAFFPLIYHPKNGLNMYSFDRGYHHAVVERS